MTTYRFFDLLARSAFNAPCAQTSMKTREHTKVMRRLINDLYTVVHCTYIIRDRSTSPKLPLARSRRERGGILRSSIHKLPTVVPSFSWLIGAIPVLTHPHVIAVGHNHNTVSTRLNTLTILAGSATEVKLLSAANITPINLFHHVVSLIALPSGTGPWLAFSLCSEC